MNRRFWNNINRMTNNMIEASTTLKVKVELKIEGRNVECALCPTQAEADRWIAYKKTEWARHTPSARPLFVIA